MQLEQPVCAQSAASDVDTVVVVVDAETLHPLTVEVAVWHDSVMVELIVVVKQVIWYCSVTDVPDVQDDVDVDVGVVEVEGDAEVVGFD